MTAARRVLHLVKSAPVQPVRLRTLPCMVCGATTDTPFVIDPRGPFAWCSVAHAEVDGWPWIKSESAP